MVCATDETPNNIMCVRLEADELDFRRHGEGVPPYAFVVGVDVAHVITVFLVVCAAADLLAVGGGVAAADRLGAESLFVCRLAASHTLQPLAPSQAPVGEVVGASTLEAARDAGPKAAQRDFTIVDRHCLRVPRRVKPVGLIPVMRGARQCRLCFD